MTDTEPFVSILIPVHNEAAYIHRCMQAVLAQEYPSHLIEIWIADGNSTDGTREIIADYIRQHPNIYLVDNPGRIVPTGLNLLIPKAKGDIIIRVDGHCVIASDYVSNCVRHLQDENVDGVGGPMHTVGEDVVSEAIAQAMSSKFGVGNSSFRTETGQTKLADTVPFPAYTREIIRKVGLYDEELVRNQDDEYNYRIREAGGKILLAEDVRSTYYSRGSLAKLWRQYFQYGFWKVRVLQKHSRQMSLRQFVPLAFVFSLIVSVIFALIASWGWILLAAIMGLYLLTDLTASMVIAKKQGWRLLRVLPFTFVIIHLGYGLGFLIGLFVFWNRWGDQAGQVPKG